MSNPTIADRWIKAIETIGKVSTNKNGTYDVLIDEIKIKAKTIEDLLIITEVFIKGIYNHVSLEKTIVCDVGMNIGVASLFFAKNKNVLKVYGYEPFEPTYKDALENFKRNPTLAKKISPSMVGLSDTEAEMEAEYSSEIKGSISIHRVNTVGMALGDESKKKVITKEHIVLKRASKIINEIADECKKEKAKLVLKLDCEESEYSVLKELSQSKLLGKIDVIMPEWHNQGPKEIESYLLKSNFHVFSLLPNQKATGHIFATKK